ncbi:hypothetical protein KJ636_01600 [Patescibacteria group bacterium]|nr:hypothetical protein [Patescibacteria group bacterium]MBU4481149.1 hypothetical protein [Patescibacteria group bacterium]
MELKKTIEQKKNAEVIKKAAENYQQEVERVKEQVEKIKEKAAENPKVDSFLNKFVHQQTLHQKLLQKLETQVPPEAFGKIKESREAHIERFGDVLLKLEDRQDKITEKLDEVLQEQKGSQFKEFKNLEVLKNLEEKVPEEAKEAIRKAQENSLKRLQVGLENMSPQGQETFKEYINTTSGAKEKHLEILEDVKAGIMRMPTATGTIQLQENLEKGKSGILKKIDTAGQQIGCPAWSVIPEFCQKGRVIMEKDSAGCFTPKCIIPSDTTVPPSGTVPPAPPATGTTPPSTGVGRACIQSWDPVCGKDGKTYSNKCFAELAGVEIDYERVCKETKCPEIKCVWDPCPGQHLPDSAGCVGCASPCRETPPLPPGSEIPPSNRGRVCAQVITPAVSSDGTCKEFPTPCEVPSDWKKVDKCPIPENTITPGIPTE